MVPRFSVTEAICDLIILSGMKKAPQGYTVFGYASEINSVVDFLYVHVFRGEKNEEQGVIFLAGKSAVYCFVMAGESSRRCR